MVFEVYKKTGILKEWRYCRKIFYEENIYAPHCIFLAVVCSKTKVILGGCRISKKSEYINFPFEYWFGIDLKTLYQTLPQVPKTTWHCGRIVIDKEKLVLLGYPKKQSLSIVKLMIKYIYLIGSDNPANILIGENLLETHRLYSILGFPMHICKIKEYYLGVKLFAGYIQCFEVDRDKIAILSERSY